MGSNEVTILASAIGVGGTILGTILGYLLNSWNNKGKLYFTNIKWEEKYQKSSDFGEIIDSKKEDAEYYNFILTCNIYNSCNNIKIMKEIKMGLFYNNNLIYEFVPEDKLTERYSEPFYIRDKITPVNIAPKSVIALSLTKWLREDELKNLFSTNIIKLTYENEKGKRKTIKVNDTNFNIK
jgi:hypothetical protein